jgi:hypothetical protein
MARRRKGARPTTSGSVAGSSAPAPKVTEAQTLTPSPAWVHIAAVIEDGGQIIIGAIAPLPGAAIAHDGKKTLAMLRRRRGEALADLLVRLDAAIVTAQSTGSRVDEINTPSSDLRYEI